MSTPTPPSTAAPPVPRRWWIRRHWKQLCAGFLLAMVVALTAFFVPRRTSTWVRSHGGTLSCEGDHKRAVSFLSWLDPQEKWGAWDHFHTLRMSLGYTRPDSEITRVMLQETTLKTDDLLRLKRLTGLKGAALNHRQIGVGLDAFRDLPEFKQLSINQAQHGQLRELKRLPQLESVGISHPRTGDIGMESLAELSKLKSLNLEGCSATDQLLKALPELPRVEDLVVQRCTQFGNDDLNYLNRMPNLKTIDLVCKQIAVNDTGIEHLSKLEHLETLALRSPWADVTDAGLAKLATMKSLKLVIILKYHSPPEQIDRLKRAVPNCQVKVN